MTKKKQTTMLGFSIGWVREDTIETNTMYTLKRHLNYMVPI